MLSSARGRLLGRLIALLGGFVLQPSSIHEQCDDADPDDEDDTENQNNTWILAGPVASLGKLMEDSSLGSVDQTDGRHRAVG